MGKFVTILLAAFCMATTTHAQSYLDRLQKKQKDKGTVKVIQSSEIDALVNGKNTSAAKEKTAVPTKQGQDIKGLQTNKKDKTTTDKSTKNTAKKVEPTAPKQQIEQPQPKKTLPLPKENDKEKKADEQEKAPQKPENPARKEVGDSAKREEPAHHDMPLQKKHEAKEPEKNDTDFDIPTVDMRRKVMRQSRKVNGYRVQVFAGGNSRADKIKAQEIGSRIKMAFPDQPVYVHFYSPRWTCRIGNYRSAGEAQSILQKIRKMGYRSAIILRGKITVQY